MSDELIRTQLDDGIFTLTLNRPDALNAMTTAVGNRIDRALRLAARDPAVRVVIVTGAGRGFCAGGDIKSLGQVDSDDPLAARYGNDPIWNAPEMRTARVIESCLSFQLLQTMPKPTIAMVNGPAIGAGMSLALACDFRVMSSAAYFNAGYVNMALSGDIGFSYFLTSIVGSSKAREIMFFPRKIEPPEALQLGLASRVVPHDELLTQTLAFVAPLVSGPTLTFGLMKENLRAALELDARTAFEIESRNFIRCFQTADHKEAVMAFKEKRAPLFKGR